MTIFDSQTRSINGHNTP